MRMAVIMVGVVVPVLLWAALPLASQGAGGSERAARLDSQIHQKQQRIRVKRLRESVLTEDITAYSRRIASLQRRIGSMSTRLTNAQAELEWQRARLEQTQVRLREQRARHARLRVRLAQARRMLAARLVELYEADRPDLVTVVLNSNGFAALLERMEFLNRISNADRRIVGVVRSARDDARLTARRLALLERGQRAATAIVLRRRTEIAAAHRALVGTRAGLARTQAAKRTALAATRVSRQRLESEVGALRRQQAKVRAALQRVQPANAATLPASAPPAGGSGGFMWPVQGPITSPFCERRAWEACHPGLDIGAPDGTPIRAPAAGKVVLMQPVAASGGYGNYTCLQHTATLSTCYAHQSRFGTSLGATARRGQVFGYVGNTGHSFGAHLHFEVRVNGSVVNPLNYL